ncbi:MAG: hypothetical protein OWV35_08195, partial [Firmicutes bacterium]|nr:hypothetical protein [Bacillota bacterium]
MARRAPSWAAVRRLAPRAVAVPVGWFAPLAALLAGCGPVAAPPASVPAPLPAAGATWIGEPGAGPAPWLDALARARAQVDVNAYLLTDPVLLQALRADAA